MRRANSNITLIIAVLAMVIGVVTMMGAIAYLAYSDSRGEIWWFHLFYTALFLILGIGLLALGRLLDVLREVSESLLEIRRRQELPEAKEAL